MVGKKKVTITKEQRVYLDRIMHDSICPECGKEFGRSRSVKWAYQHRGQFFCSYTCFRKDEKKRSEKKRKVVVVA